jgi:hypothetical protein
MSGSSDVPLQAARLWERTSVAIRYAAAYELAQRPPAANMVVNIAVSTG